MELVEPGLLGHLLVGGAKGESNAGNLGATKEGGDEGISEGTCGEVKVLELKKACLQSSLYQIRQENVPCMCREEDSQSPAQIGVSP